MSYPAQFVAGDKLLCRGDYFVAQQDVKKNIIAALIKLVADIPNFHIMMCSVADPGGGGERNRRAPSKV